MAKKILILCISAAVVLCVSAPVTAAVPGFVNGTPKLVQVEKGHSRLIKLPETPKRVSIADQSVADVLVISPDQVYINGRKVGKTNITVWGKKNEVMANYLVHVGRNLTLLKKMLHKLIPGERVEVHEMEGVVVLSGRVSTKEIRAQAESLASIFSTGEGGKETKPQSKPAKSGSKSDSSQSTTDPGAMLVSAFSKALTGGADNNKKSGSTVRNLIEVGDQKQVLIKLKFAEVNKGALKKHTVNLAALGDFGYLYTLLGGSLISYTPSPYDTFMPFQAVPPRTNTIHSGFDLGGGNSLLAFIDIMKGDDLVQILAEPNLACLSGENASFLAGGEFPVPVPQDRNTTIYFKPYGIQLNFQPTVLSDGRIQLSVEPEVSEMDMTNAITVGGYVVPGLITRRAKTKLELANGQSFALAGLLKRNLIKEMKKYPLIGDIPILGQLFRSQKYQNDESELLIVCTPQLVDSNPGFELIDPESFREPSDLQFYLASRYEALPEENEPNNPDTSFKKAKKPASEVTDKGGMKMEGKFGHEVVY